MSWSFALLALSVTGAARAADPPPPRYEHPLPAHVTRLTDFGERPDFSPDGKHVVFLDRPGGDVFRATLATRTVRPITKHYPHEGIKYYRALYLSNGDVLLTGGPGRGRCMLYVLDRSFAKPPVPLEQHVHEGPAVSRRSLRIAWSKDRTTFLIGTLAYEGGVPQFRDVRTLLRFDDLAFEGKTFMETQNFRPRRDRQLTFALYGHGGTEAMLLDLDSGRVTNLSKSPDTFDEPEGIFPDGKHTLIESTRDYHGAPKGSERGIDIWKLAMDGSGRAERLTAISQDPDWIAANPVVSDDGRVMAFSPFPVGANGVGGGAGILLFDLAAFARTSAGSSRPTHPARRR